MSGVILLIGLIVAASIVGAAIRAPRVVLGSAVVASILVLAGAVFLASFRWIPTGSVGIVKKSAFGANLPDGQIIATDGEKGIQADVLPPGFQAGYWPVIFDVDIVREIEIQQGKVGLVEARDGLPLDPGQVFAPEVQTSEFKKMVEDASYFLGAGKGRKGPQSNVLTPGKYRVNTELFNITIEDTLNVPNATVTVLKANFGDDPTIQKTVVDGEEPVLLAKLGEKGVRADPLPPGNYPVNTKAFETTTVSTKETILRFTSGARAIVNQTGRGQGTGVFASAEETEITVRTSDGFTFPVDVRVEYRIEPQNAPVVVAKLGSDGQPLIAKMNSTVRAIFRNNAENVKALDYVNQRSQQERQSLATLAAEMEKVGVKILAVRIGDVGDETTLGELLKTQRDREIAVQQQITFQEQQRAAEQKKELERTEQEAQEERRLATASYEVQIAGEAQRRRIIEAEAEAKAIEIEAIAQAEAYRRLSEQVGSANTALLEMLRIVGQSGIQITPRVMVSGERGESGQGETVALIGTMLDTMIQRDPDLPAQTSQNPEQSSGRTPVASGSGN
ncbi:MAG: SPFH domain-containing protein [Planctomycetota bacterium]